METGSANDIPLGTRAKKHVRSRLISGLLVIVPLGVTIMVLRLFFNIMASFLRPFLNMWLGGRLSPFVIETIAIALFILVIYLVGLITAYVVGRKFVSLGEALLLRIPVIRTIYGASKQVVDTFSHPEGLKFREVVFLEFPRAGIRSVGFVTGSISTADGTEQCVVFVPTAPNPTTGFVVMVPGEAVERTSLSIEEGIKMIVSGGVLIPDRMDVGGGRSRKNGDGAAGSA